jgi:2-amino-4-hydroxy-6-hydroxymethyldihydropteridine diphosphokinase
MKAVIALGANLEDPQLAMDLAVALLSEATELLAVSTFHKTKPVGGPPQPDYLNAVCIIESELSAGELLSVLHGIEKSMGRVRLEQWGPRIIDLDLITFGNLISDDPDVLLPHPRAYQRTFVLEPWLEIDPDAELPGHGRVDHLLNTLPGSEL